MSLLFCIPLLACCVHPTKTVIGPTGSAEGSWRGRALVRNLKTGKSNTLAIDIVAKEPSRLRMEVGGPFGVHVASIALNETEVRCDLTQQRRFIYAPSDSNALARLIPVKIPPRALVALLFDRPFSKDQWDCDNYTFEKLPVECRLRDEPVTVKWLEKKGLNRRLRISTPDTEIEMVLDESKSKVQGDPYVIEPPNGYKIEHVGKVKS